MRHCIVQVYIEEGQRRMTILLLFYIIFTHRVIKMSPVINNPVDL